MAETAAQATSCGFVALIGAPNAGKSTLLNALVGSKISIVTPKVQTTRALIRGIAMEGAAQLIFVDTPGIFAPRRRLDRAMVGSAWGSTHDADVVAFLIDAQKGVQEDEEAILRGLTEVRAPKVLVLNKVDIVEKPKLLALAQSLNERATFAAIFMISARTGDGVGDLKAYFRGACAVWALALSGGPDLGRTAPPARRRDYARESFICGCIRNCPTSRRSRPRSGRN